MSRTSSNTNLTDLKGEFERAKKRSKSKKKETGSGIRVRASIENVTSINSVEIPTYQQAASNTDAFQSYRFLDAGFVGASSCSEESPTLGAFKVRNVCGKLVRDVSLDTHDLINEPGGFLINLEKHGDVTSSMKSLRIHLGIRQKSNQRPMRVLSGTSLHSSAVYPGTLAPSDDYSREIFREIKAHPELEILSAILEINDKEDLYYHKYWETHISAEFLKQFIQTYPTALTKFQIEMPGISGIYLAEWKFLMEQQTCLEELICNFGVVMWHFYEMCVWKNSKTLKRIVLRRIQSYDVQKLKYVPLNWALFSSCRNLRYLKVTGGFSVNPTMPLSFPPSFTLMHENLDMLPQHEEFAELHIAKIWVGQCELQAFRDKRPNLTLCMNCNDMEYYDADLPTTPLTLQPDYMLTKEMRLLQLSRVHLSAEIPATTSVELLLKKMRKERDTEPPEPKFLQRRYSRIVMLLFLAILLAIAILFIIIMFRHLRGGDIPRNNTNITIVSNDEIRTKILLLPTNINKNAEDVNDVTPGGEEGQVVQTET